MGQAYFSSLVDSLLLTVIECGVTTSNHFKNYNSQSALEADRDLVFADQSTLVTALGTIE